MSKSGFEQKKLYRSFLMVVLLLISLSAGRCFAQSGDKKTAVVRGVVFEDINRNGMLDAGEKGIAGVGVSNGIDVVLTDRMGRYKLVIKDEAVIFVIKPAGWMTRVDALKLPRFYYIYNPLGSPKLCYSGVESTGKLPDSINFGLYKRKESKQFNVIIFGDPQVPDKESLNYLCHAGIEEVAGIDAVFGVTLGDITGEAPLLLPDINKVMSLIGIDWYNLPGNHDMNYDADGDEHSLEAYKSIYGPTYYAFNYGLVHFVLLDTIIAKEGKDNRLEYDEGLTDRQLEFVKNDLAHVDKDKLVVVMSHAGLNLLLKNQRELLKILEKYPHTLSVAGHQHETENVFLGAEQGWHGKEPHHIYVSGAVSGAWWSGFPDDEGVPHAMMRNGVPNGYSVISFDKNSYSIRFKAFRRSPDYQMRAYAPDEIDFDKTDKTEIILNVFAGSERNKIEMKIDAEGNWETMEHIIRKDPYYEMAVEREAKYNFPRVPWNENGEVSGHIWQATLPVGLSKGAHLLYFRSTDMFGQSYSCKRVLRVK